MQTPRTEFAQALRAIAAERGLEADVILDTIEQAIIAAYKRDARERGEETEEFEFEVEIDPSNGEAKVFSWPLEKPEEKKDVTPPGFGRIAAQTAKQVIHQKIREAEKGAILDEYSERVGSLISGMILRFDGPDVRIDLGRAEGVMPKEERIPNERLNPSQRLTFLLKEIVDAPKGRQMVLSRASAQFVEKLFQREVPEIASKSVEIKAIAREAGVRTKMAVFSNQSGVDPVGSCVGQKGVRVQAVTNEIGGERVDIIQYTDDQGEMVKASLAPAENLRVKLDDSTKVAVVTAPEDQLSLAIGKEGQNARLAAKLTGWKIEIKAEEAKKTTKKKKEPETELKKAEKKEDMSEDPSMTTVAVSNDPVENQKADTSMESENGVSDTEKSEQGDK